MSRWMPLGTALACLGMLSVFLSLGISGLPTLQINAGDDLRVLLSIIGTAVLIGELANQRRDPVAMNAVPRPLVQRLTPKSASEAETQQEEVVEESKAISSYERISTIIDERTLITVFQPIVDLVSAETVGVEALTRFETEAHRAPDSVFREAKTAGLGTELELLAIRQALNSMSELDDEIHISLNASPETLQHPNLYSMLADNPDSNRLVIELTEHVQVIDYESLLETLRRLRAIGVRFAVDDMGAGFANLRHVIRLDPDIIKLDLGLTRNIDRDTVSQAMALALVSFGRETRTMIVAEGIETEAELTTLRQLGVHWGQGYFLARPGPLPLGAIDLAPSAAVPKHDAGPGNGSVGASGRVWSIDQYEQLSREAQRAVPSKRPMLLVLGGIAALLVAFLYWFQPVQIPPDAPGVALVAMSLLAAVGCFRGARSAGITTNTPWLWFGMAATVWGIGSLYWILEGYLFQTSWSYPSPADVSMALVLPLLTLGLLQIVRKGLEQTPITEVIADGLIVLTLIVVVIVELLALPSELTESANIFPLLTTAAIGALGMPVFFLTLVTLIWQRRLIGSGAMALILCGIVAVTGGTIAYSRLALEGAYHPTHPIEIAWILGFGMIAAGSLAIQKVDWWELQRQPSQADRLVSELYSVVPGFAVIAFALLSIYAALNSNSSLVVAVGVGFTGLLLAIRLAYTSRDTERLIWQTHERDRLESVLEASVTIANTNDLDALLERVAEVSAHATRSSRAQIRIYGEDRSEIQAMGDYGSTSRERAIAARLASVPFGLIPGERYALDSLMPKVQRSDDSQLLPEVQGLLQACGKDITLIAPLIADRKVIGVIETWSPSSQDPFESVDLAALAVIGQEAGIAIQNTQLLKELHWQANHDGLTGLLNHRSAIETLEKALDSAIEHEVPMSILVSDIDNFKQINDAHGHLAGDRVLIDLSRALRDSLKPGETAGRYGGDEFLAILPGRDFKQAENLALHFVAVANQEINQSSEIDLEVSIGIATFPEDGDSTMELIATADERMYSAKTSPRYRR